MTSAYARPAQYAGHAFASPSAPHGDDDSRRRIAIAIGVPAAALVLGFVMGTVLTATIIRTVMR